MHFGVAVALKVPKDCSRYKLSERRKKPVRIRPHRPGRSQSAVFDNRPQRSRLPDISKLRLSLWLSNGPGKYPTGLVCPQETTLKCACHVHARLGRKLESVHGLGQGQSAQLSCRSGRQVGHRQCESDPHALFV